MEQKGSCTDLKYKCMSLFYFQFKNNYICEQRKNQIKLFNAHQVILKGGMLWV
jgi:hypothetical protein